MLNNELRHSLVNVSVNESPYNREIVQYVVNENLVVSIDHLCSLMIANLINKSCGL